MKKHFIGEFSTFILKNIYLVKKLKSRSFKGIFYDKIDYSTYKQVERKKVYPFHKTARFANRKNKFENNRDY